MPVWLKSTLWAALLMPLGIVLHEGAHYLAYVAYDLPQPTLSYAFGGFAGLQDFWTALQSGDRAAAAAIAPIRDVGITALAGVVFTFVIGFGGLAALVWRGSLFGGVLAFTALFRSAGITLLYVRGNAQHSDEAHVEQALGIPGFPLVLVGAIGLLASLILLVRKFGWKVGLAVVIATIASLAAWMTVLGPIILPA